MVPYLVFILKKLKVVVVWYLRGRRGDANTVRFSSFCECLFAPNLPQLLYAPELRNALQMVPRGPKVSGATRRETSSSIYQIPNTEHMAYRLVRTLVYKRGVGIRETVTYHIQATHH